MRRQERSTQDAPRSVPWPSSEAPDVVCVDTTWDLLQPLEAAPGVRTVGELELMDLVAQGAHLVDCRTAGSLGGHTIVGSVRIPHDEILARVGELDRSALTIVFCNGPQCPQSPDAIRRLLDNDYPAPALAYYRGGLHDWITLAMPTEHPAD